MVSVSADKDGYYAAELHAAGVSETLRIQHVDSAYNKGCVALHDIESDTELYSERPHIRCRLSNETVSHTYNVQSSKKAVPMLICDYCSAYFTDNLPQYISTHIDSPVHPLPHVLSDAVGPIDSADVLLDFTAYEHAAVYCADGCGEVYCDLECRDNAYLQYHQLLCTHNKPAEQTDKFQHAWQQFTEHAAANNETFMLPARIFADIYLSYTRIHESGATDDSAMQQAMYAYQQYNNALWHDQKTQHMYHTMHKHEVDEHAAQLQSICNASYTLLSNALSTVIDAELYQQYFTAELFSRLLAAIEMNQYKLTTRSPLYFYYEHIMSLDEPARESIIDRLGAAAWQLVQDEAEWQCIGSGLLRLTCCINHSCVPNTVVDKPAIFTETSIDVDGVERSVLQVDRCDDTVTVMSVDAIKAGEQLLVSYIDEDADLDERTEELAEYMFVCTCDKCGAQRSDDKLGHTDDGKMSE